MNSNTDLEAALGFVIGRIRQEAQRSGKPLNEDEEDFLGNLPTEPINPSVHSTLYLGEGVLEPLRMRDFQFERLCNLAKEAHKNEIAAKAESARQWNFAAAVLRLNNHPMSWLLHWAGIKVRKTAASADGCLLLTTAIFLIVVSAFVVVPLVEYTSGLSNGWKQVAWTLSGCFYVGLLIGLYFWTRRLEVWQGKKTVEKYRCGLDMS